MKNLVITAQKILKTKGLYTSDIDGIIGAKTLGALDQFAEIDQRWAPMKQVIAFIQLSCKENNFDPGVIDGLWGPNSSNAYEEYLDFLENGNKPRVWRPEEILDVNPNKWPLENEASLKKFYGEVGGQMVRAKFAYPHKLAWDTDVTVETTMCHPKVKDSLERVSKKVFDFYGMDEIKRLGLDMYGGCYNKRRKRGGTTWSTHARGIALDYDPANNRLKWGRDKARFSGLAYDMWWKFWEEEGWVSLGRQRNFDWMHIQAAKIS